MSDASPPHKPKYVHTMYRKDGRKVCYYRRPGCAAIPLPITIGSREFQDAYDAAVEQTKVNINRRRNAGLAPSAAARMREAVIGTMADSGVYLLVRRGRVTYVGTSKNCGGRIAEHRQNGRQFDKAFYIFAEGTEREWLEALLIRQLDPEENKRQTKPYTRAPSVRRP
jgi:hypothetical protein